MGNRSSKPVAELFRPLGRKAPRTRGTVEDNPALHEIWHAVLAIPHGRASTYGAIARAAGLPGRARQVGFALRIAPEDMHLPWHRVVGAGGKIVFPPASREHREQARRLRSEGIKVVGGRVAPSAMLQEQF
jgi:methylated-DNA-protein-cysteine methyltransferase-like protein